MMQQPAIARQPHDSQGFRISPDASNHFACLFDPVADGVSFTLVVEHVVENTGPGGLCCLTFMTPNEGFAELIRNGTPVAVTEADRAVIAGHGRLPC